MIGLVPVGAPVNILRLRLALWMPLEMPNVERTNNHAERNRRGFVIWRKISFGTKSAHGSRYVERIMTVAVSSWRQGRTSSTSSRTRSMHTEGMAKHLRWCPHKIHCTVHDEFFLLVAE